MPHACLRRCRLVCLFVLGPLQKVWCVVTPPATKLARVPPAFSAVCVNARMRRGKAFPVFVAPSGEVDFQRPRSQLTSIHVDQFGPNWKLKHTQHPVNVKIQHNAETFKCKSRHFLKITGLNKKLL